MRRHPDSGGDEQRSEDVDDEVERLEQLGSQGDEDRARDQRTDDTPEKDPALVLRRDGEVREDESEDEELQYRGRGRWREPAFAERVYVMLSLGAKSALARQVYAGALAG